jgi:Tfp pilus assembly protein PilV
MRRNQERQAGSKSGSTLLEVMIAMSILALGATSILSIFVAAVSFQTQRVENNRITELRNWARHHAQIAFNRFDPTKVKKGERPIPAKIVVDLTDAETASASTEAVVREAAEKFPGFKYEIILEEDQFSVSGSSVVAHIRIFRLSGQLDETQLVDKEFLTRSGVPYYEYFRNASFFGPDGQGGKDKKKRGTDPSRR